MSLALRLRVPTAWTDCRARPRLRPGSCTPLRPASGRFARAGIRLEPMQPILLLSTASSAEDARRLARLLVEERLAACVNVVGGVRSIYRWQGEVQEDGETLLLIKTSAERYAALAERLLAEHPYDTPELIRLDLAGGDPRYLAWLVGEVEGAATRARDEKPEPAG